MTLKGNCGPVALMMLLDHWGVEDATLAELEIATETGPHGTSLLALKKAAQQRGLSALPLQLPADELRDIPPPAIAHVHGDHFIVIRSAGEELVIDDPARGRLRISTRLFARSWTGVVLITGKWNARIAPSRDWTS